MSILFYYNSHIFHKSKDARFNLNLTSPHYLRLTTNITNHLSVDEFSRKCDSPLLHISMQFPSTSLIVFRIFIVRMFLNLRSGWQVQQSITDTFLLEKSPRTYTVPLSTFLGSKFSSLRLNLLPLVVDLRPSDIILQAAPFKIGFYPFGFLYFIIKYFFPVFFINNKI